MSQMPLSPSRDMPCPTDRTDAAEVVALRYTVGKELVWESATLTMDSMTAIKQYLLSNNLLSDTQFGFCQGHSAPALITAEFQIWTEELNSRGELKMAVGVVDEVKAKRHADDGQNEERDTCSFTDINMAKTEENK
eukprot:g48292.t1